jgi:hypothetical protein
MMMRLLVILLALSVALPAAAGHSRLGYPDNGIDPGPPPSYDATAVADVLVCIDIDANAGFADLSVLYADAFVAAGATDIAFCGVEVSGGAINFPPDVTSDNYPVVAVLTSENWWTTPQNIDPVDEEVLAAYLDTGGNLLLVGQDYMYGAHPDMNSPTPCYGFPLEYLGLEMCYQDVVWAPVTANVSGSTGWLFDGDMFFLDSETVFLSNPFFPDIADPAPTAGYALHYDDYPGDGVMVYNDPGTFKTVWAGIEIGAAVPQADFFYMIDKIYDWFLGTTPVEDATWGEIKALFR